MKRDNMIVEFVLRSIEALPPGEEISDVGIYNQLKAKAMGDRLHDQVKAAMLMLYDAGYIEARVRKDGKNIIDASAWRLTWAGAELLSPFR